MCKKQKDGICVSIDPLTLDMAGQLLQLGNKKEKPSLQGSTGLVYHDVDLVLVLHLHHLGRVRVREAATIVQEVHRLRVHADLLGIRTEHLRERRFHLDFKWLILSIGSPHRDSDALGLLVCAATLV